MVTHKIMSLSSPQGITRLFSSISGKWNLHKAQTVKVTKKQYFSGIYEVQILAFTRKIKEDIVNMLQVSSVNLLCVF